MSSLQGADQQVDQQAIDKATQIAKSITKAFGVKLYAGDEKCSKMERDIADLVYDMRGADPKKAAEAAAALATRLATGQF